MTDILQRLRDHPGQDDSVTEQFRTMVDQRHEAAVEIERLLAALKRIEQITREALENEQSSTTAVPMDWRIF